MIKFGWMLLLGGLLHGTVAWSAAPEVEPYIRKDFFGDIKISPTGEYYAATVPLEDSTGLAILRRSDKAVMGRFRLARNSHVSDFWWVNPERVLISVSVKIGDLDEPRPTGEIFGMNVDGSKTGLLVGQRVEDEGLGTLIKVKKAEHIAAFLVDDLPGDDDEVIISVMPFTGDPMTCAERMNVYTGRRTQVARAPVQNAEFTTDGKGVVRFARGIDPDLTSKLFYRADADAQWELINDSSTTDRVEAALGFSSNDGVAYLQVEQTQGPDQIVAMDTVTRGRKVVLRDDNTDPWRIILRPGSAVPVGALFMDGKPRMGFFDEESEPARTYRSLEEAFGPGVPVITSSTQDGRIALVRTFRDRDPGLFFLYDAAAKSADMAVVSRAWVDRETSAEMRPIAFKARDGLDISGYLTLPLGGGDTNLPMVLLPHGGPYGVHESWSYDSEVQLLAAAGYAVLQVDYRGSGNHGRAFLHAGAREWGAKMQDDLTDATRWAITQGVADPERICIYGASYGGYAALMGAAKEPGLYRCAAGYVGVYDLPMMHTHGDIQKRGSGATYVREWVGEPGAIAAVSPVMMAERIRIPVFLAAGGEDERAPIEHTKKMQKALESANVPVETLYFDTEGHGFYQPQHRIEYYTKLLAFLDRNIGQARATASGVP